MGLERARPAITPGATLERAKVEAQRRVDELAERRCLQFVTPGSARAMTYADKAAEAERFLAEAPESLDPEDWPWLAAQAAVAGGTLAEAAAIIVAKRAEWRAAGAAIDQVRLAAKAAIAAVEPGPADVAAVQAILDGLAWPVIVPA